MSRHQPSGIVLLLSMLIVSTILTAAVIFGVVIARSIQQSRLLDQSIVAYYMAESGVEKALYETRKLEAVHDCTLVQPGLTCTVGTGYCSAPGDTVACVTANKGSIGGGMSGSWQTAVNFEPTISVYLEPGDSFQTDLFNTYQINSDPSGMEGFVISSDLSNFRLYAQLTNLTWVVDPSNPTCSPLLGQSNIQSGFVVGAPNSAAVSGLAGGDINSQCQYTLRLSNPLTTAGGSPAVYTIALYSAMPPSPATAKPIPSRLVIQSSATFGRSTQIVKVRTPIRPPVSGLYDFVVFSDTQIQY